MEADGGVAGVDEPAMADLVSGKPLAIVAAVGAGLAVVFFIIGLFIGKATTR